MAALTMLRFANIGHKNQTRNIATTKYRGHHIQRTLNPTQRYEQRMTSTLNTDSISSVSTRTACKWKLISTIKTAKTFTLPCLTQKHESAHP